MTEQELIFKLQALKQIKPSTNWVASAKMSILESGITENKTVAQPSYVSTLSNVFALIYGKKKLAYSFAVLLFVFTGIYGAMQFSSLQQAKVAVKNSTVALLAAQIELEGNVSILKEKSRSLADTPKDQPESINLAAKEVESVVKNLTESIKKDPQLAKAVALDINNNKTLLSVVGSSELKEASDDLYKTIDEQMIADLEKTTLTESLQKTLVTIKNLYNEKKYASALESILLLGASIESK